MDIYMETELYHVNSSIVVKAVLTSRKVQGSNLRRVQK